MRTLQGPHTVAPALLAVIVVSLWAAAAAARADCDRATDPLCSRLATAKPKTSTAPHTVKHGLVLEPSPKPRPPPPKVYVNPPEPPDPAHNGGGSQPHT